MVPISLTVATAGALEEYVYATLTAALAVVGVGVSVVELPVLSTTLSGLTASAVSAGGGVDTVMEIVPSRVLTENPVPRPVADTVIVAVPAPTAVTTPEPVTVATLAALVA
jgi:hypothetical protein